MAVWQLLVERAPYYDEQPLFAKRLKNQRKKMLKALRLVQADLNECEAIEKMYLGVVERAFAGDVKAVEYVFKLLLGECYYLLSLSSSLRLL